MTLFRFVGWSVGIVVVCAAGASVWLMMSKPAGPAVVVVPETPTSTVPRVINTVSYVCDAGLTIKAAYAETDVATEPVVAGQPPVPTGQVVVDLGTAPTVTLMQSISADGARYANSDESLVFWSKGQSAMVLESGSESTYKNCIAVSADTGVLPQVYHDGVHGFTVRYPNEFTAATYTFDRISPKQQIPGVKFTVSGAFATGTNLSRDSYVSIEYQGSTTLDCDASAFLQTQGSSTTITDGDMAYSFASSTDAGAGNRYEEMVYVLPNSQPCMAIRTFVHSTVLENYDPGTVRAFDSSALHSLFTAVRRSLITDPRFAL